MNPFIPLTPEKEAEMRKVAHRWPQSIQYQFYALWDVLDRLRAANTKLVQIAGNFEPGSEEETESFIQRIEQAVEQSKKDAEELQQLRALPCRPPGTPEGMQVLQIDPVILAPLPFDAAMKKGKE